MLPLPNKDNTQLLIDVKDHKIKCQIKKDKKTLNPWINLALLGASKGHLEIAQLLVEEGANVNYACTDDGMTALILASQEGHLEIARLLVGGGANVNAARTTDGWTAMMWAARDGNLEIVRLLLTSGADKAALTHAGRTAHSLCAAHPAIRALLA